MACITFNMQKKLQNNNLLFIQFNKWHLGLLSHIHYKLSEFVK